MTPKHIVKGKIVEINLDEFNKFVNYVKDLKEKLEKCIEVNKFLNGQIREFNKEFSDENK